MRIKMMTLLLFLTLSAGCASNVTWVLQEKELIRVKSGQNVTATFDGWLLSDRAVNRIMDTEIKGTNLE